MMTLSNFHNSVVQQQPFGTPSVCVENFRNYVVRRQPFGTRTLEVAGPIVPSGARSWTGLISIWSRAQANTSWTSSTSLTVRSNLFKCVYVLSRDFYWSWVTARLRTAGVNRNSRWTVTQGTGRVIPITDMQFRTPPWLGSHIFFTVHVWALTVVAMASAVLHDHLMRYRPPSPNCISVPRFYPFLFGSLLSTICNLALSMSHKRAIPGPAGYYKSSSRKYHFTAVPQCPFPDAAMGSFLQARGNLFTYILVQVRRSKEILYM